MIGRKIVQVVVASFAKDISMARELLAVDDEGQLWRGWLKEDGTPPKRRYDWAPLGGLPEPAPQEDPLLNIASVSGEPPVYPRMDITEGDKK